MIVISKLSILYCSTRQGIVLPKLCSVFCKSHPMILLLVSTDDTDDTDDTDARRRLAEENLSLATFRSCQHSLGGIDDLQAYRIPDRVDRRSARHGRRCWWLRPRRR